MLCVAHIGAKVYYFTFDVSIVKSGQNVKKKKRAFMYTKNALRIDLVMNRSGPKYSFK